MSEKRPLIVTFIGDINVLFVSLSIILSIASLFPGFLENRGFSTISSSSFFSNAIVQLLLSIILLIAAYGFLKLKKWGYWLMITYDIFFLAVYIWSIKSKQTYISTNIMMTVIELIFVLPTKKYFYEENLS